MLFEALSRKPARQLGVSSGNSRVHVEEKNHDSTGESFAVLAAFMVVLDMDVWASQSMQEATQQLWDCWPSTESTGGLTKDVPSERHLAHAQGHPCSLTCVWVFRTWAHWIGALHV